MQKFLVAFYLIIFFNNTTLSQASETKGFLNRDLDTIGKQLDDTPLFAKSRVDINPPLNFPRRYLSANTYTNIYSIQKNLGTVKNLSFTTWNNVEQCADSMRFFSCSFANISRHSHITNGIQDESEIAAAIRLSDNQFVTRSQQKA